ncbi:S26 family signal peptidase, partial [Devosia neptuniae]|uniref:S26 family signal peptidase n=1 Tax=Devosia neptuniae TaxID=191302 RepID=UPI0022AE69D5
VLIDKLIYSVNEPLFHHMIIEREAPQRDEVAVFMLPDNPGINYIKRVVGVPGDRVTYKNKVLTGEPLTDGGVATYEVKIEEGKS